jgi:hypothetical protein
MIHGRLGRESTLLKNGKYIKDLSYMNRDLKDIIYIDFDDEKAEFHKENVVILPRWDGDRNDRELYDIMAFLENIGQSQGGDVRQEIQKYGREGTGKKYNEVQSMRRDFILKQRVIYMDIIDIYRIQDLEEYLENFRQEEEMNRHSRRNSDFYRIKMMQYGVRVTICED